MEGQSEPGIGPKGLLKPIQEFGQVGMRVIVEVNSQAHYKGIGEFCQLLKIAEDGVECAAAVPGRAIEVMLLLNAVNRDLIVADLP